MVILLILMSLSTKLLGPLIFPTSCAGVVAAVGEVAKDVKHLAIVK